MPKLISLLVCEKVITDAGGMASLINIFQRVNIGVKGPLALETLSPLSWCVFALWHHSQDEMDAEFTQQLEITMPNGNTFVTSELAFSKIGGVGDDYHSKNIVNIFGVPAALEGVVMVRVKLKDSDIVGEYPFFVRHIHEPEIPEADPNAFK